jgi:hypothetical protein
MSKLEDTAIVEKRESSVILDKFKEKTWYLV